MPPGRCWRHFAVSKGMMPLNHPMARVSPLLFLPLLALSCASLSSLKDNKAGEEASPFELTASLDTKQYAPGQAVICQVSLRNRFYQPRKVRMPDRESVKFAVLPNKEKGQELLRFVMPVFSEKDKTGEVTDMDGQSSVTRHFVFTTLAFERGEYVLQCVYSTPKEGGFDLEQRVYARATTFTVEGAKAVAHRYEDGVLAKEDAIALAAAKAGGQIERSDAMMVWDEMGFKKWWVNLWLKDGKQEETVKSYFVDPYLARVWKEAAAPFVREEKAAPPGMRNDPRLYQQLRERERRAPTETRTNQQ